MHITTFTPKEFRKHQEQLPTQTSYYQTAAGIIEVLSTETGIYRAQFVDHAPHASSQKIEESLLLVGTPFQIKVWQALLALPANTTISYQELAELIGHPSAWRAVANAVSHNPIAYFVPCHRVICKNGKIGGYRWGIERKEKLLSQEQF